jgi:hypothetical protein
MTASQLIRLLYSLIVFLGGLVLTVVDARGWVQHIGLAFMVAGLVSAFHEVVLRHLEADESAGLVAKKVVAELRGALLHATGIRLVAARRTEFQKYLEWTNASGAQTLFFAGRSILHRIDGELQSRRRPTTADKVIVKRVIDGAAIRILLLDPRSDLAARVAREEGQTASQFLTDIGTSIGICERIHETLADRHLQGSGDLEIKIFDQIPYFAYHQVDDSVMVGFYFLALLGHSSPAYEVIDEHTKKYFREHFETLFRSPMSRTVLKIDPYRRRSQLDIDLVADLRKAIADRRA